MKALNIIQKSSGSRLAAAVNACLNAAHFSSEPDMQGGFYSIKGMSGRRYRYFINSLVRSLGETSYLEIGSWVGSTLCSAIHGNHVRAVAIDNWSEFGSEFGSPRELFYHNVKTFMTPETRVHVIEGDFRIVDYSSIGLFEIYLFDGPHEEKDQYEGLTMALGALNDEFIFIVDDWNWQRVRKGTLDAIRDSKLEVLYAAEIRTTLDDSLPTHAFRESDWHNGYYISVLSKKTRGYTCGL